MTRAQTVKILHTTLTEWTANQNLISFLDLVHSLHQSLQHSGKECVLHETHASRKQAMIPCPKPVSINRSLSVSADYYAANS